MQPVHRNTVPCNRFCVYVRAGVRRVRFAMLVARSFVVLMTSESILVLDVVRRGRRDRGFNHIDQLRVVDTYLWRQELHAAPHVTSQTRFYTTVILTSTQTPSHI